jgi:hypothetical protein
MASMVSIKIVYLKMVPVGMFVIDLLVAVSLGTEGARHFYALLRHS